MKTYYGNYLGLVVNSSDPEYRGRVQVFVPHVMPALYDGWNKEGIDIQVSCVGSNINQSLTPEIHQRLVQILPWAEAASPIIGSSAPGNLFSSMVAGAAHGAATGGIAGAVVGAAAAAGNHFFSQQPSANPTSGGPPVSVGERTNGIPNNYVDLIKSGSNNGTTKLDIPPEGTADSKNMNAEFANRLNGLYKDLSDAGYKVTLTSGYRAPTEAIKAQIGSSGSSQESLRRNNSSGGVAPVGRSKHGAGIAADLKVVGSGKYGTVSITNISVSQNSTNTISPEYFQLLQKHGLHRPMDFENWHLEPIETKGRDLYEAAALLNSKGSSATAGGSEGNTATSDQPASANPHATPDGTNDTPKTPQGGMVAGPPGTGTPAGTVSGGGTVSETGISKEALEYAMRMAASESGAGVLPSGEVMKNITDPDLMLGYSYNSYAKKAGAPTVSWNGVKRTNDDVRQLGRQARALPGFNPNSMDLGYTQHNLNDASRYGLTNSGSYKGQVLSVARHVQNQANSNPGFAAALQSASRDGAFSKAEEMNAIPGWNINSKNVGSDRYNEYMRKKGVLSERIDSEFGGDPFAALEAIDKENPATPTANEMLGTNYIAPAAGTGQGYTGTGAPSVVNNTDGYGRTPIMNNNDMASGLFAYPNPGAMVWVFFREGNPLYPVYFAASYSSKEWSSAYRGGSHATGYLNDGNRSSTAQRLSFGPQGGIWSHFDTRLDDTTGIQEKASMMLYHKGGSNLTFDNGIDFYHSHYARRDEVEQDRFIVTKGYKDEWVEGDSSTNVRGDLYVKVGKLDQETMDALQKMADFSSQLNAQLTNSEGNGGGSSSDSTKPPVDPSVLDDKPNTPPPLFEIEKTRTEVLQDSVAAAPTRTWLNKPSTGSEAGPTIANSIKQYQKL